MSRTRPTVALAVCAVLVSCGGDGSGATATTAATTTATETETETTAPPDDARLAIVLCDSLRAKTNALVTVINDSVAKIYDSDEAERSQRIRDGFAAADRVLDEWAVSLAALDLPPVPEAERLRTELLDSIPAGHAELADEVAAFEGPLSTIPDGEVRGAVGAWQNTIEKVMSVTEPRIERYERVELQRAFLDEPSCRNVVQPFRID